jgi:hypothetical protein
VKFEKLGTGYDLWVSVAAEAIDKKNDICEVLGQHQSLLTTPEWTSSSPIFSFLTTPPNHCLLHLDHTASSLLLIQTSTQLRRLSYIKFSSLL